MAEHKLLAEAYDKDNRRRLGPELPDEDNRIYPYIATRGIVEAVNLSILLGRPLLLKGEPGCGKSQLAKVVAYELYQDQWKEHFRVWPIKSTTKSEEGRYTIDHIRRLRDAQLYEKDKADQASADPNNILEYIHKGVLWEAFEAEEPMILLIDEVDKADIDFPNDLLMELDEKHFSVPEVRDDDGKPMQVEANRQAPPIIFITSNSEKRLPDAFLRRCLFYYLPFPSDALLGDILAARYAGEENSEISAAVQTFRLLRDQMEKDIRRQGEKKVSTSELVDWYNILRRRHAGEIENTLPKALENLHQLPYASVLLKSWEDHRKFLKTPEK